MRIHQYLPLCLALVGAPAVADTPLWATQAQMPMGWFLPQMQPQFPQLMAPQMAPQMAQPMPQPMPQQREAAPADPRLALLAGLANPQTLDGIMRLAPLLANPPAIEGMAKLATVAADPRTVDAFIKLAATLADPKNVDILSRLLSAMTQPKFAEALITLGDPKVLAAGVTAASVLSGAVSGAGAR